MPNAKVCRIELRELRTQSTRTRSTYALSHASCLCRSVCAFQRVSCADDLVASGWLCSRVFFVAVRGKRARSAQKFVPIIHASKSVECAQVAGKPHLRPAWYTIESLIVLSEHTQRAVCMRVCVCVFTLILCVSVCV